MRKSDITPELVRALIQYDPATGRMVWKIRDACLFLGKRRPAEHLAASWNQRFAGKAAFHRWCSSSLQGNMLQAKFTAHRIAWACHYGVWPSTEIDHIDGNPRNNQIDNLRVVNRTDNMRNRAISSNNTSGHMGVSLDGRRGRWTAYIGIGGRRRRVLGCFDTKEEAIAVREAAESEYGYHRNHGRPLALIGGASK